MTKEQRDLLHAACEACGMSLQDFCLEVLRKETERVLDLF